MTEWTRAGRAMVCGLALAAGLSAAGCERRVESGFGPRGEVPRRAVGGGPQTRPDVETALDAIARARCAHEMQCGNVRSGGGFASVAACMTHDWTGRRGEFASRSCARGVDAARLAECVSAVQALSCDEMVSRADELAACDADEVCR